MASKYSAGNPANKVRPGLAFAYSHPAHMIALWFGAGCIRPAPGTWGTAAGVACWIVLQQLFGWQALAAMTAALFVIGAWAAQKTGDDLGVGDAGCVVVDEVAAVWMVCLMFPQNWVCWLASFAAFRVFDIVKLPPASTIDARMHNGAGVMLDDFFAGLWAIAALLIADALAARAGLHCLGVF
ncbi:MAG: phosphatidylglycerophosphatase A [Duodenibacillus sp.]|nr:phosphatidylglycerophosphatase A [Duodenibacillus sp.]